jgi:hypothetical protein
MVFIFLINFRTELIFRFFLSKKIKIGIPNNLHQIQKTNVFLNISDTCLQQITEF